MDLTGVDIIVNAVVGKSLRSQEGCNTYIFTRVKERVHKEVCDLVAKGHTQLDIILLQKKRLQAMFCGEKLLYEATNQQPEIEDKEEVNEEKPQETKKEKEIIKETKKEKEITKETKKEKEITKETKKEKEIIKETKKPEKEKEVKKSHSKEKEIKKPQDKEKEIKKPHEKEKESKKEKEIKKPHEKEKEIKKEKDMKKEKEIKKPPKEEKETKKPHEKEEIKKSNEKEKEGKKLHKEKEEIKKPPEKGKDIKTTHEKEKEIRKPHEKEKELKNLPEMKKLQEIEKGIKTWCQDVMSEVNKEEKGKGTNGVIVPDEKPAEKPVEEKRQSKQYFEYLAEYKNDPDVYERVKGMEVRGKGFPMSNDGSCPRCSFKLNAFVVLDFLFPAGDMPEILHYLLTLGKAVLWSSKQSQFFKDPPIFLCQGKCPTDIGKCGFNINWRNTDLDKIFLFPEQNYKCKVKDNKPKGKNDHTDNDICSRNGGKSSEPSDGDTGLDRESGSDEEYDEGDVDICYYKKKVSWVVLDETADKGNASKIAFDEEAVIRTMLALEEARLDFTNGEMRKKMDAVQSLHDSSENKAQKDTIKRKKVFSNPIANLATPKPRGAMEQININYTSRSQISPKPRDSSRPYPTTQPTKSEVLSNSRSSLPTTTTHKVNNATATNHVTNTTIHKTTVPPKKDDKEKTTPTPTHVFKGATYYNETKQPVKPSKPAFTSHDFPISKDGICPYCHSADVVYIILQEEGDTEELPTLLEILYKEGKAVKRKKGEYDLPSFQCRGCTYGFNLDWKSTNLEKIFSKGTSLLQTPPPAAASTYPSQNTYDQQTYHQQTNNYASYNNANNASSQYAYNTYQQQAAMMMNAYNYMQPSSFALQAMIASALPYMQAQYGMKPDFSKPPPGFPPQTGYNSAYNTGMVNNQYTSFPPPPSSSLSSTIASSTSTTASTTTSSTPSIITSTLTSSTSTSSTSSSTSKFSMRQLMNDAYVSNDKNTPTDSEDTAKQTSSSEVKNDLNASNDSKMDVVDSSELYDPLNESNAAESSELYDPLNESGAADSSELYDPLNDSSTAELSVSSEVSSKVVDEHKVDVDSSELYDPFVNDDDAGESASIEKEKCSEIPLNEDTNNTPSESSVSQPPLISTDTESGINTSASESGEVKTKKKPVRKTSTRGKRSSTRTTRRSKGNDPPESTSVDQDVSSNEERPDVAVGNNIVPSEEKPDVAVGNDVAVPSEEKSDVAIVNNIVVPSSADATDEKANEDDVNEQPVSSEIDSELTADDVDLTSDSEVVEDEVLPKTKRGVKRKASTRGAKRARGRGKGKRKK